MKNQLAAFSVEKLITALRSPAAAIATTTITIIKIMFFDLLFQTRLQLQCDREVKRSIFIREIRQPKPPDQRHCLNHLQHGHHAVVTNLHRKTSQQLEPELRPVVLQSSTSMQSVKSEAKPASAPHPLSKPTYTSEVSYSNSNVFPL
jgi:hypothetical protein